MILVRVDLGMWVSAIVSFVIEYSCFMDESAIRQGAATCFAMVREIICPFEKEGDAPRREGHRVWARGESYYVCVL